MEELNVAVIGCGYWGPNLIRNFNQINGCTMKACCDLDRDKLQRMSSLYPGIKTTDNLDDILSDESIVAVAIATPVYTHAALAKLCFKHDKHVFIEKPMAACKNECLELIEAAEEKNRVLMVGHTFEYTAAVNKVKEIIESGVLGEIIYIRSSRLNLGLFQPDINVIWDLAPHDISIILYLLQELPVGINASGKAHFKKGIEDVATVTLDFPNGTIAFIHSSWLDPDKIRKMTFVGSKKMLVYDDISTNEKIKIFDKGVDAPPYYNSFAEFHFSYRYGDIFTPRVQEYEPLKKVCEHFLSCIRDGSRPRSDGYSGLRVVSILEAANKSLRHGGAQQKIDYEKNSSKEL
ncbi:Gfo/Idh/MocA family oxidoreductase [candidate division KSB1 bacterium]|nr:Gfo/Idh/MocA family oxidoreductase [candidate division KSB1 bacterium]RQW03725.1 MAG: gfo/Idh/MocA family oxidoreductase [candidate division KSB1 bacterium]